MSRKSRSPSSYFSEYPPDNGPQSQRDIFFSDCPGRRYHKCFCGGRRSDRARTREFDVLEQILCSRSKCAQAKSLLRTILKFYNLVLVQNGHDGYKITTGTTSPPGIAELPGQDCVTDHSRRAEYQGQSRNTRRSHLSTIIEDVFPVINMLTKPSMKRGK